MGDRTNPIKFGPEWLRNLSRERAITRSATGATTTPPGLGGSRPGPNQNTNLGTSQAPTPATTQVTTQATTQATTQVTNPGTAVTNPAPNPNNSSTRILLARLRYGREEMLALYDRQTAEAPAQLKTNDTLYQPRGKPPYALNTSFEEDSRDSMNRQPLGGLMNPSFSGRGRGQSSIENKSLLQARGGELRTGRARGYMRSSSAPRGWNNGRGGYNGIPDDDPSQPQRPWSNNNAGPSGLRPNNGELPEWQNKPAQYRAKRQTNTNWRQHQGREDGEEWRSTDGARRPLDKWTEFVWQDPGARPTQDKPWLINRRTWVAGDNNEDPLPEWAVDNAEACGGTFDSTGAFHGYSNDDSNLPKNQESPYPLVKSHTHGSFSRAKMAEEGSEEWWASEKAKKLSPKRFDTTDIKKVRYADNDFKKPVNAHAQGEPNWSSGASKAGGSSEQKSTRYTGAIPKEVLALFSRNRSVNKKQDQPTTSKQEDEAPETKPKPQASTSNEEKEVKTDTEKPYESETKQTEKGNIQSVIITPSNNSLRQKHQNIAVTPTETPKQRPKLMSNIGEFDGTKGAESEKIVEDILQMSLDDGIPSATINQLLTSHSGSSMNSFVQGPYPSMQTRMPGAGLQGLGLAQPAPMQQDYNGMMGHPRGMTNSMLNASLGLPVPSGSGVAPSLSNTGLHGNLGLGLQGVVGSGLQQAPGGLPGAAMQPQHMQGFGVQSNMQNQMPMPDMQANSGLNMHNVKTILQIPAHLIPHMEKARLELLSMNRMYGGNVMNQPPPVNNMGMQQAVPQDTWYYEDPNNMIQGPFSSQDMYNWFRAGFFSPQLMVRKSCETTMRPLGSYGPMPFGPMDLLSAFPPVQMGGGFELGNQQSVEPANQQPGLGANVQSVWGQPANNTPAPDPIWLPNNNMNEAVNRFPYNFWNNQSSDMPTTMLPEKMKTEDEILAQMRAAQAQAQAQSQAQSQVRAPSPLSFFADPPPAPQEDANLNMNQLQKLIQKDLTTSVAAVPESPPTEQAHENLAKADSSEVPAAKPNKTAEKTAEVKPAKEVKKQKSKETAATAKSKKTKDEKKEDTIETKPKEEEVKQEKRSAEPSPSGKNKKEDKSIKKELDKEKKEWIKEGFTIVKGAEKTKDKDSKKKAEEAKAAEEAERKKKEEEKVAAEEKKRQQETKKQQQAEAQSQTARQAAESVVKKAPWSASQAQPSSREGPTLAEIQRLEREKKLEQMKEQQQMMQIIAQQQAAALAREQEVQSSLGWAKKPNSATTGPTLAEIQAEARLAAAAAAAAAAVCAPREEALPTPPPVPTLPWANVHNGGAGFWDSPQLEPVKPAPVKPAPVKAAPKLPEPKAEAKNKKKVTVMAPPKRENSPSVEFDMWCTNMLVSWRETGIDVPTFVSFLRDIESPYEVKDYVKCYLGDTRESNDFARQFLEKRSRLMRVGTVTPSDDLCSPAVAVNPRTNSGSDHTDLKAKGKKTKKNKMLKVDARNILGFSVTASEDRINVGDIDTV